MKSLSLRGKGKGHCMPHRAKWKDAVMKAKTSN